MHPYLGIFNEEAFRVADCPSTLPVIRAQAAQTRCTRPASTTSASSSRWPTTTTTMSASRVRRGRPLTRAGGRYQFTNWTGVEKSQNLTFYTNEKTIQAFETWVKRRLNRRNHYSGIRLCDDPNVLAIETINEAGAYGLKEGAPPRAWTARIAKLIKRTCGRHMLVIDGSDGLYVQANGTIIPGLSIPDVGARSTDRAVLTGQTSVRIATTRPRL